MILQLTLKWISQYIYSKLYIAILVTVSNNISQKKSRFHWRRNPSIKQSCCSLAGTAWNWYRWYRKLIGYTWLIFINEECGNLTIVVGGEELTRNNDRKRKSEVLQAYIGPLFEKCLKRDWGKYDFSCGYIFLGRW